MIKRTKKIDNILKLAVLVFVFLLANTAQAATPASGLTNSYSRVRDTAGFTKVLAVLAPGTRVNIVGEKGVWYQIKRLDGSAGWMAKELIDVEKAPAPAVKQIEASSKTVDLEAVWQKGALRYNSNFRKSPNTESAVIALLPKGTKIETNKKENDWCAVRDEAKRSGWIYCPLIAIEGAESAPLPFGPYPATPITTINNEELEQHWLGKLNKLRSEKGLRVLGSDASLRKTAATWADYIGSNGLISHDRPDGQPMLEWADSQKLDFTVRNSEGGWKNNYFTENIGLRLNVEPTAAGMKSAIDGVMDMFLAEGPSGVHYRSLFHPDWNSLGISWYSIKNSDGRFKVYFVIHYGSIAKP